MWQRKEVQAVLRQLVPGAICISGLTPWPEQFLRRMGLFLFPEVLDHLADVLDVFE